jgi:hypothetical protein
MTDDGPTLPEPKEVEYHPVTGVPEEFHDYLHKDSEEFKKLKAFKESGASEGADKGTKTSPEVWAYSTHISRSLGMPNRPVKLRYAVQCLK